MAPDERQVEVAGEHLAFRELEARRTRRARKSSGQYNPGEDFFGSDVIAHTPYGYALLQMTKASRFRTKKFKGLECLRGSDPILLQPWERRIVGRWDYERVGRRTQHHLHIKELIRTDRAPHSPTGHTFQYDGTSRRITIEGIDHVWADWTDPVPVDESWYKAEEVPV